MRALFKHTYEQDLGNGATARYCAGFEYEIDEALASVVTKGENPVAVDTATIEEPARERVEE